MPVGTLDPSSALPRSHCFLSFAYGQRIRTVRIRKGVLQGGAAAAALLTVWMVASSAYLVFHDDLVAQLMARAAATQYAYEDRIAALRAEVDRESSQKLVGQTTLDGKLKELAARAALLETRSGLLAAVAAHATPGAAPAVPGSASALTHMPEGTAGEIDNPALPTGSLAPGARPRPQVEGYAPVARPLAGEVADLPAFNLRLAAVTEHLEHVDAGQLHALGVLRAAAQNRAEALRGVVAESGLSMDRLNTKPGGTTAGMGGPFVPLDPAITNSTFGRTLDAMKDDLATVATIEQAVSHVPLAKPLTGPLEVTSPFGARIDPFLGRAALHTGVDLREETGTDVRSTASGRVVTAGPVGGYGNMIELDHGHGLTSRYAHLSAIDVTPGTWVEKGAVIGEVGATGRATGPHLHYEVRIDGEPVDPERFLLAGSRLAALDARP